MSEQLQLRLRDFISEIGAVVGTLHVCESGGLRLAASVNIPDAVLQAVAWVPSGKGMAGLALERGEPVTTCNLSDDRSGNVRPGAKAVNAQAAVALPLRNLEGIIVAVLGVAFADARDLGESELAEWSKRACSFVLQGEFDRSKPDEVNTDRASEPNILERPFREIL